MSVRPMRFGFSGGSAGFQDFEGERTLHDHPPDVGVEQALADAVRILGRVGVAVVGATGGLVMADLGVDLLITTPPADRALDGAAAK
jgi:hypothetical protein